MKKVFIFILSFSSTAHAPTPLLLSRGLSAPRSWSSPTARQQSCRSRAPTTAPSVPPSQGPLSCPSSQLPYTPCQRAISPSLALATPLLSYTQCRRLPSPSRSPSLSPAPCPSPSSRHTPCPSCESCLSPVCPANSSRTGGL